VRWGEAVMILKQAYFGNKQVCVRQLMGGRHTGGSEGGNGSGLGNINLEQHTRQDQMARVSRATVAEAMTEDSGHR
jgi:hypothetical protein